MKVHSHRDGYHDVTFVGILERQNFTASFAEEVIRGCHVRVRILEVPAKHITVVLWRGRLTMSL